MCVMTEKLVKHMGLKGFTPGVPIVAQQVKDQGCLCEHMGLILALLSV